MKKIYIQGMFRSLLEPFERRFRLVDKISEAEVVIAPFFPGMEDLRKEHKEIYVVGVDYCHTIYGDERQEHYRRELRKLKESGINLVYADDTEFYEQMIICPEESRYDYTDRKKAYEALAQMVASRSGLTFTRTNLQPGNLVHWKDAPDSFRQVIDHCVRAGAYKPFNGVTVGHFSHKLDDDRLLISRRKTDYTQSRYLVEVTLDEGVLTAYGAKPSAGSRTQYIIFSQHPEYDSIVHFHCPLKQYSEVPVVEQFPYECGSHECGYNTSRGLKRFSNLSAVYIDNHGPNIVFHSQNNPQEVIDFINVNFDLTQKTGGLLE